MTLLSLNLIQSPVHISRCLAVHVSKGESTVLPKAQDHAPIRYSGACGGLGLRYGRIGQTRSEGAVAQCRRIHQMVKLLARERSAHRQVTSHHSVQQRHEPSPGLCITEQGLIFTAHLDRRSGSRSRRARTSRVLPRYGLGSAVLRLHIHLSTGVAGPSPHSSIGALPAHTVVLTSARFCCHHSSRWCSPARLLQDSSTIHTAQHVHVGVGPTPCGVLMSAFSRSRVHD